MSYVSLKYVLSVCHARLSVRGSITAGFETLKCPFFASPLLVLRGACSKLHAPARETRESSGFGHYKGFGL